MKLLKPTGYQSQKFGENPQVYSPLKGHPAEDYDVGYRKNILCVVEAPIYSILNQFNPSFDKYRAIFQIFDDTDFSYEISYGHIYDTPFKEGDIPKAGDVIATEGNYGFCFANGKPVTPEEKLTGLGSHLHFQVRKCKRVPKRAKGKTYLRNSEGFLVRNGMMYEVVDYDNGYNGCINPAQFYAKTHREFPIDINYGDRGAEVVKLQLALQEYGYDVPATGQYLELTAQAVLKFQLAEKVAPSPILMANKGYHVHALTRNKLNKLFN